MPRVSSGCGLAHRVNSVKRDHCMPPESLQVSGVSKLRSRLRTFARPLPLSYLLAVDPILVGVIDAVDNLLFEPFLGVGRSRLQRRHSIDHIDRQIESVHLIQNSEFQRCINVALLLVSPHVKVIVIRSSICQLMDQRSICVEVEDHRFVRRKQVVKIPIR